MHLRVSLLCSTQLSFNFVTGCTEENQGKFKFNSAHQPPANDDDNLFRMNISIIGKSISTLPQDGLKVSVWKTNYVHYDQVLSSKYRILPNQEDQQLLPIKMTKSSNTCLRNTPGRGLMTLLPK
jgi:hypothetical protein